MQSGKTIAGAGKKSCKICDRLCCDMKDGYCCSEYGELLEQENNHVRRLERCRKEMKVREALPAKGEAFCCPKCDENVDDIEYYNFCPSCGARLLPPPPEEDE